MSLISWDERNSIIRSWAFTSSPYPIISVSLIYLWIVFRAGPNFMKNRRPFDLTLATRLYNIFQIAGCLFFNVQAFKLGFSFYEIWKCTDEPKYIGYSDEFEMKLNYYQWWYIFLRMSEFLETIFFVLRKKFNQVSILHVYHHISIPFLLWIFLMYSGGRMELCLAIFNSHVHVIMYGYYFLSSFHKLQKYTNLLKPLITAIQILQLFILFIHCVIALLPGCHASRLFVLQAINLGLLIFMFLKFYFENYLSNSADAFFKFLHNEYIFFSFYAQQCLKFYVYLVKRIKSFVINSLRTANLLESKD
ncbi:unnamed protein product [Chironomus riparius]|uniref:Elongation of very long chain fatty acids protein n=1 Tax=Chironomus riparius TaxID=315576 RepID=A0A9P0NDI5_9DIPT|nr:unnamed protein product [Chironomus riparius]